MNKRLYKVRHGSWSGAVYVAAFNQTVAAKIASKTCDDTPETCSVEYVADVMIEGNEEEDHEEDTVQS